MTDTSLAALLLTNRIVDVGQSPLSAGEFWSLCAAIPDPSILLGMSAADIATTLAVPLTEGQRYTALFEANTAFAFERQRLGDEGLRLVSALDADFPDRLRQRLGRACPSFLIVAGALNAVGPEAIVHGAIGVAGSRDAPAEALAVASSVAPTAAAHRMAVVSGLARGVDQHAMTAAVESGVPVIGVPSEGLRVAARRADLRRWVHSGTVCLVSPYAPTSRFSPGNAMGRNKLIYALADVTLVIHAEANRGGTWAGATEALRRGFGSVAVWMGAGAGPGNVALVELGAAATRDADDVLTARAERPTVDRVSQASLF